MEPTNEIKQMTALWDLVTKPQERNYPSELEEKDREEYLEKKWHCNNCNTKVNGLDYYGDNGPDDTDLIAVQCEHCGLTLWRS